ncbi:MAG: lysophospholipid acyltransferase family protein [Candidatus Tectimicrobiota bacterium]
MRQTLANRLLYLLIVGVLEALARLPRPLGYWLGARFGDVAYVCLRRRRRITLENLALAFGGEKSLAERRRIARATFRHLGQHLIDFSHLGHSAQAFASMCRVEGLEHIQALLERRAGLLIISAHFGSWELSSAVAPQFPAPLHVIVRPLDNPALQRLTEDYRHAAGYRTIPKREALATCLKVLRQGEIVALLMDQSSLRRESVPVEFFGVSAYTPMGPALLALRARCPVVSGFLICEGPGRHRLVFSPEIPVQRTGNLQQDIVVTTQAFTRIIETYVRRYPEQWFWLHRRWKRRSP